MNRLIILLIVILAVGFFTFQSILDLEDEENEFPPYLGPVPEGYDEDYFRLTGETILEVDD